MDLPSILGKTHDREGRIETDHDLKSQVRPMKQLIQVLVIPVLFTACSAEPDQKRDRMQDKMENIQEDIQDADLSDRESFESDRQDILGDLRDLRSDINDDLADSEERLVGSDLDQDDRLRHERLRTELMEQRALVEDHLTLVENAEMHDWVQVQEGTRRLLKDADILYEREGLERRRPGATSPLDLNRNAEKVR
jgi:hypothetical protein